MSREIRSMWCPTKVTPILVSFYKRLPRSNKTKKPNGLPLAFAANFLCVSNNQHPHLGLNLKIFQEASTRSSIFPDHREHSATRISTSPSTRKSLQDPWPHNLSRARQNHHRSSFFPGNSQICSSQI